MNRVLVTGMVEDMLPLVEDGMSATDALTKVATERKVPVEYVKLAAFAYNTGTQEAQRTTSTDILGKLATFDLADPEEAIRRIWNTKPETKVASDYNQPPTWLKNRYAEQEKKAVHAADAKNFAKKADSKSVKKVSYDAARRKAANLKLEISQASLRKAAAVEKLTGLFAKFATYFHQVTGSNTLDLDSVQWTASAKYGGVADDLFDYVRGRNRVKQARVTDKSKLTPYTFDDRSEPWATLSECMSAAKEANVAMDKLAAAEQAYQDYVHGEFQESLPVAQTKKASPMSPILGYALGGSLRDKTDAKSKIQDEETKSILSKIERPSHLTALRNIQVQAMLQDMLANDDVISGYDPNTVMRHFNELHSLMPTGALKPTVMRAALRESLALNPAVPETAQFVDIERKMRSPNAGEG